MQQILIGRQAYLVLRRETEDGGPRAGKADRIFIRKPKGKVVLLSWDHGPSARCRFEDPFKVGDDAEAFFNGSRPAGVCLFPDPGVQS